MKKLILMLLIVLISGCGSRTRQRELSIHNDTLESLKGANEKPNDNSKFMLENTLTSKEGDNIGSIFVKQRTDNTEVFSALIITVNGSLERNWVI